MQVGENIVFHVRSNKYVEHLNYVISNSGKVLESSSIRLAPYNMRTFHVLVTKEMAPLTTLLVWHMDSAGYVVAQSLPFPVDTSKGKHNLVSPINNQIRFNREICRKMADVEVKI